MRASTCIIHTIVLLFLFLAVVSSPAKADLIRTRQFLSFTPPPEKPIRAPFSASGNTGGEWKDLFEYSLPDHYHFVQFPVLKASPWPPGSAEIKIVPSYVNGNLQRYKLQWRTTGKGIGSEDGEFQATIQRDFEWPRTGELDYDLRYNNPAGTWALVFVYKHKDGEPNIQGVGQLGNQHSEGDVIVWGGNSQPELRLKSNGLVSILPGTDPSLFFGVAFTPNPGHTGRRWLIAAQFEGFGRLLVFPATHKTKKPEYVVDHDGKSSDPVRNVDDKDKKVLIDSNETLYFLFDQAQDIVKLKVTELPLGVTLLTQPKRSVHTSRGRLTKRITKHRRGLARLTTHS